MESCQGVLLATGRRSTPSDRVIDMTTSRLTGPQLRALREKHDLSQLQLGQLARATISTRPSPTGGIDRQCGAVQKWEDGTNDLPAAVAELIETKLFLLEVGWATFDHLVETSLKDIMRDMWS